MLESCNPCNHPESCSILPKAAQLSSRWPLFMVACVVAVVGVRCNPKGPST